MFTVTISPNEHGNPPGKLADAELHFTDGPLAGLKLIGFAVWERRGAAGRNVTFPARQYSVNGERRSYALLRPIVDSAAQARIEDDDLFPMALAELLNFVKAKSQDNNKGQGNDNHKGNDKATNLVAESRWI